MTRFNDAAPILETFATDIAALAHGDDDNRAFCDGGIFIAGLKGGDCPKCGAGPDDQCRALFEPEYSNL